MKQQQTNPEISPTPHTPEVNPTTPQQVPPAPQPPEIAPGTKDPRPSEQPMEVPKR